MRFQRSILSALAAVMISGCMDRIPPKSLTQTRMHVIKRRILQYARAHNQLPPDLASLPPMSGFDTSIVDGWKRSLTYQTNSAGIVTLASLGRDGVQGGSGDDADIVRSVNAYDGLGKWSEESIDWRRPP